MADKVLNPGSSSGGALDTYFPLHRQDLPIKVTLTRLRKWGLQWLNTLEV